MSDDIYCADVTVLASATSLGLHGVSREVYDALPGTDEMKHMADTDHPLWSKKVTSGPFEVNVFTYEPPNNLITSDADNTSPRRWKGKSG